MDKLAHKWDAKLAVLERLQVALKETPRHRAKKLARLRERITALQEEVAALQVGLIACVEGGRQQEEQMPVAKCLWCLTLSLPSPSSNALLCSLPLPCARPAAGRHCGGA